MQTKLRLDGSIRAVGDEKLAGLNGRKNGWLAR